MKSGKLYESYHNHQVIMMAEPTVSYNASFEGALINLSTT